LGLTAVSSARSSRTRVVLPRFLFRQLNLASPPEPQDTPIGSSGCEPASTSHGLLKLAVVGQRPPIPARRQRLSVVGRSEACSAPATAWVFALRAQRLSVLQRVSTPSDWRMPRICWLESSAGSAGRLFRFSPTEACPVMSDGPQVWHRQPNARNRQKDAARISDRNFRWWRISEALTDLWSMRSDCHHLTLSCGLSMSFGGNARRRYLSRPFGRTIGINKPAAFALVDDSRRIVSDVASQPCTARTARER